jgi:hypothetical protein
MKTLTKSNLSLYLFNNDTVLNITATDITVGNPVDFIISDCNSNDTVLHENVTSPEDWVGCKYFFDGVTWTLNPDWIDPETLTALTKNI